MIMVPIFIKEKCLRRVFIKLKVAAVLGIAVVLSASHPLSSEHFHWPALQRWMCSDKELTLLFLYSSLPRQPSTQSATQPAIQLHLLIHPSSQQARPSPALPCPAQNWQPPGVIRVSAPLACLCARIIRKHQAGTCKFMGMHLNQRPDIQIIYLHEVVMVGASKRL